MGYRDIKENFAYYDYFETKTLELESIIYWPKQPNANKGVKRKTDSLPSVLTSKKWQEIQVKKQKREDIKQKKKEEIEKKKEEKEKNKQDTKQKTRPNLRKRKNKIIPEFEFTSRLTRKTKKRTHLFLLKICI